MKSILRTLAFVCSGGILTGCVAVPPDVTARYYFPKAETQLLVTETVGCSPQAAAGAPPVHRLIRAVMTVAPTTTNSADMGWPDKSNPTGVHQGTIRYRDFSGPLSDVDIAVTLTADGRLAGINASSTGEGGAIIKNLVTVAGVAGAFGAPAAGGPKNQFDLACDVVDKYAAIAAADATKVAPTVTLTYSVAFTYDFGAGGRTPALKVDTAAFAGYDSAGPYGDQSSPIRAIYMAADPAAAQIAKELNAVVLSIDSTGKQVTVNGHQIGRFVPVVQLVTTPASLQFIHTVEPPTTPGTPTIELTEVAMLGLKVAGYVGDLQSNMQIWASNIPVPTRLSLSLPIPKPASFGKTAFSLALSDYGSVTNLHYGTNTPVTDVSDAAAAFAKAFPSKTAEDRANDIKGQADLIAQQQRLVSCEVDPKNCK